MNEAINTAARTKPAVRIPQKPMPQSRDGDVSRERRAEHGLERAWEGDVGTAGRGGQRTP